MTCFDGYFGGARRGVVPDRFLDVDIYIYEYIYIYISVTKYGSGCVCNVGSSDGATGV